MYRITAKGSGRARAVTAEYALFDPKSDAEVRHAAREVVLAAGRTWTPPVTVTIYQKRGRRWHWVRQVTV